MAHKITGNKINVTTYTRNYTYKYLCVKNYACQITIKDFFKI